MQTEVFQGLMIPFLGTALGSACVLFMKDRMNPMLQRALTGFAAGVMVAASIWSLLIPAMEQSEAMGKWSFIPAVAGFWLGILFLLVLDRIVPHLHMNSDKAEGPESSLQKTTMLVLAVTLHNLPEGMAVGVVYAGLLAGNSGALFGNCHTEFPGGRNYLHAPAGGGRQQKESIPVRCALRRCGANRRGIDDSCSGTFCPRSPVPSEFCGWGYALCCRGGIDPGDVGGRALQRGYHPVCRWICGHDGP